MRTFLLAWILVSVVACAEQEQPTVIGVDLRATLAGGDIEGYLRADGSADIAFPKDHGPHHGYRNEWWYLTGHLQTNQRREFGFQGTFFRTALSPKPRESASAWASTHLIMAHFAITDIETETFVALERMEREALGLAGAEENRVWLHDWEFAWEDEENLRMSVDLAQDDIALILSLEAVKKIVLQGDEGLSQKGGLPGQASYYYSVPRMAAKGTLDLSGQTHQVHGEAWLDREWSSGVLGEDQVGWDWIALQLDDGTELMYYRMRLSDGSSTPTSKGVLVNANGEKATFTRDDVVLEETGHWVSPRSHARYPMGFKLRIPTLNLEVDIEPVMEAQELCLTVVYWEGAVNVSGNREGKEIRGRGYVELTGYAGEGGS